MDKLKPYLLTVKKYHFWILIFVAVAALFYAWGTGTAELEGSFKKNKSNICIVVVTSICRHSESCFSFHGYRALTYCLHVSARNKMKRRKTQQ